MKQRMLIVDDEQDICDLLHDFFSARGFEVASAFSGEEALRHLRRSSADVVLLDILLPGVSGIEVLRRARKIRPRAKFIMVSALDQDDLRQSALESGASDYITKPFNFDARTWSAVFTD